MTKEELTQHTSNLVSEVDTLIRDTYKTLVRMPTERMAKRLLSEMSKRIAECIAKYIADNGLNRNDGGVLFNSVAYQLFEDKLADYVDSRRKTVERADVRVGMISFEISVIKTLFKLQEDAVRKEYADDYIDNMVHDSELLAFFLSEIPADERLTKVIVNIEHIIEETPARDYDTGHPLHANQLLQTLMRMVPEKDYLSMLLIQIYGQGDCWNFIMRTNSLSLKGVAVEILLKYYQQKTDVSFASAYVEKEKLAKNLQKIYKSSGRHDSIDFCLHVLRKYSGRKNNNKSSYSGAVVTFFHRHKESAKDLYTEIFKIRRKRKHRRTQASHLETLKEIRRSLIDELSSHIEMPGDGSKAGCYTAALLACLIEIEGVIDTEEYELRVDLSLSSNSS